MLGYFPTPYNNETIYSIVARYANHMGIVSKRKAIEDTFNITKASIYDDYIIQINNLIFKIKHFSNEFTEEYFLNNHTIFPLFAPFMGENHINSRSLGIYVASRKRFTWDIPEKEYFSYCSDCAKEEMENYGECFWNRIFQIPGVLVCSKHKKTLCNLKIDKQKNPLNKFIMPDHDMNLSEEVKLENKTFQFLLEITRNVEYFFVNNVDAISYKNLYEKYYEFIKICGIASQISQTKGKLANLILSRFNEETLDILNSNPLKNDWLSHLSVERLKNIHPIRHVLLMMTLNESVQNFINTTPRYQPFGTGPWLCMNPLSEHYLEKVISNIEITYHRKKGDFQGLFTCSCGHSYVLFVGETNPCEIKEFYLRVKVKGEVWEREFDSLVNKKVPINEIAKKTNQSRNTVRKIIRQGHNYTEINKIKRQQEIKSKKQILVNKDKEEWIKLINKFPECTRTELKDMNNKLYNRLQNYAREWLDLNLPKSQRGLIETKKDIIHKKDLKYLKKAKDLLNNWLLYEKQAGKIIKKTPTALYSRLGIAMKLKEKYPLTENYISTFIESTEDYQIRLIDQCIEIYFKSNEIKKYKVLMFSGLRKLEPKAEIHLENKIRGQ